MISSRPVLQRVAEGNTSPGGLWAIMTVEVAEDADVIPIRVRDANLRRTAKLAEAVGRAYHQFVLEQLAKAAAEVKQLEAVARGQSAQLQAIVVGQGTTTR